MSPLDTHAADFYRGLKKVRVQVRLPKPRFETETFQGDYLEKWFLKVLWGLWASGNLPAPPAGDRYPGSPPKVWARVLLGEYIVPERWGLYMAGRGFSDDTRFRLEPVWSKNVLYGAKFIIAGHEFVLKMSHQLNLPNDDWIYRPSHIVHFKDTVYAPLRILWPDGKVRMMKLYNYGTRPANETILSRLMEASLTYRGPLKSLKRNSKRIVRGKTRSRPSK